MNFEWSCKTWEFVRFVLLKFELTGWIGLCAMRLWNDLIVLWNSLVLSRDDVFIVLLLLMLLFCRVFSSCKSAVDKLNSSAAELESSLVNCWPKLWVFLVMIFWLLLQGQFMGFKCYSLLFFLVRWLFSDKPLIEEFSLVLLFTDRRNIKYFRDC